MLDGPNPESDKLPPIPVVPVPTPKVPHELELPNELAWQRYRLIETPKKHVTRLAPKVVSWKATRLLSTGNLIPAGILYMIAGLLYSGSPFRSTKERQYISDALNAPKAVEKLVKAFDVFTMAEAVSYGRLVQECLGLPLMQITAEEMDDSCFAWLQEVIPPLSVPVYDACLAFKRGSYLFNFHSNPKEAISFFQKFLHLAKTAPDGFPVLDVHQLRLDVDRSQETVRHENIADDFIFDYARAVKQFLRPNYFAWWLCLASKALVQHKLMTTHNCSSTELTLYLNHVQSLVELLDNSISALLTTKPQFKAIKSQQQLRETLLFEFSLEAATALADASNLLLLCEKNKESQKMIIESLDFVKKGLKYAQELNKLDWNVRFRLAYAIIQFRLGHLKEAEEILQASPKSIRKHKAIKDLSKLIAETQKKGKLKEPTKKRIARSIKDTLVIQPIDWIAYDWSTFLGV